MGLLSQILLPWKSTNHFSTWKQAMLNFHLLKIVKQLLLHFIFRQSSACTYILCLVRYTQVKKIFNGKKESSEINTLFLFSND